MRSFITGLVSILGLAIVQSSAASLPPTGHPDSAKVPPQNAIIVSRNSKDSEGSASFSSISAALASLPNDNTDATVYIYAGDIYILPRGLAIADMPQDHTMSNFLRSIVPVQFVSLDTPPGTLANRTGTTQ